MTEAAGGGPDATSDETTDTEGDDALKDGSSHADINSVFDGIGGKPRMTWSSVTDTGGSSRPTPEPSDATDRSSFQFDLGGALARLGGDEPPVESPVEPAVESDTPNAPHEPSVAPVAEPTTPITPSVRHESEPEVSGATPADVAPEGLLRPLETPFVSSSPSPAPADEQPLIDLGRLDERPPPAASAAAPPADRVAPAQPDYPRRVPGTHLDPRHRLDEPAAELAPAPDVGTMPEIREATPVDATPHRSTPRPSVFGDLEPRADAPPTGGGVTGAPNLPGVPASMPTLPASNPAAPPPVAEPVSDIAGTPDITALRSAQLRASRQQRQGKLFGRSLLAFVVVGGLIAAAMVFGRSLLFSTEWDGQLTPIVNQVEADRGTSFDRPVSLTTLGSAEFGDRLRTATIGSDWLDRVPEWRALNLAVGEVTADTVADELVRERSAFYDPVNDEIVLVEGASDARTDLRLALEAAFDAQQGAQAPVVELAESGFVGLTPAESIAQDAVDRYLANPAGERATANESLPIPIAYELVAANALGQSLLIAGDIDPNALSPSSPDIEGLGSLLGDDPANTASGLLQPGDRPISDSVALGTDDWSLVWATRLPDTAVARLADQVTADAYRVVDRGGITCVIGAYQARTAADADAVFASMLIWAAAAPEASQAAATQIAPTRVQIEACDPGVAGGTAGNPGVVDGLIDRQIQRLTN